MKLEIERVWDPSHVSIPNKIITCYCVPLVMPAGLSYVDAIAFSNSSRKKEKE
jgi:hypothetical protein